MSQILRGSAVAGFVGFAVSVGIFAVVRLLPDDLSRGVLLTFIGLPLLVVTTLYGGWVAAVRSRRVVGVFGAVVAAIIAVLLAAMLLSPLHGLNGGAVYLILAGFAAISTAAGYLICAAGLPKRADA